MRESRNGFTCLIMLNDITSAGTRSATPTRRCCANGEDPKVVQELLRHSSIKVTMDVYTQAITDAKRKTQSKVVEMIVPKKTVSQVAPV